MLFSSLTFLFAFLPITLILYFLVKDKYKNYVLLVASLIFYAWGEPKYVILMILSIIFNYFIARLIDKKSKTKKLKKFLLFITVFVNIGALFIFKYLDFAIENLNVVFNFNIQPAHLSLPIGISFYTFQILSYVIDVYRKKVKVQKNIFTLGTYIALFPQLIAGPIVRYSDVEKQLKSRTHSLEKFCDGFRRFILGFVKKVLIANNVAIIADTVFNDPSAVELGPVAIVISLLAYALQIYYDFSGYSDMAIGLGKIFGFDFDENFNYPYSATSLTDFWRRWHISLTSWFRDYVYIPLGGNRCSKLRWLRNFSIVWLLTGFWHGASWNFVLWGVFNMVILLIEKQFLGKILAKIPKIFTWISTFIIVNIGWLLFRVNTMDDLGLIVKSFFHPEASTADFLAHNFSIVSYFLFMILGLIFMFPVWKKMTGKLLKWKFGRFILDIILLALFCVAICALVNSSYNPFIYFRF
ncbi:MBOAT family protein [Candidatus Saccharibacteria bacterium]|nr:MBOAT family protein [Candidatus Saccharibacteria bacterium]